MVLVIAKIRNNYLDSKFFANYFCSFFPLPSIYWQSTTAIELLFKLRKGILCYMQRIPFCYTNVLLILTIRSS